MNVCMKLLFLGFTQIRKKIFFFLILKNAKNHEKYRVSYTGFIHQGTKMKYKIQNTVIIEEKDGVEVRDIVYEELNEQDFLVKYLQNPSLIYWQLHDDGSRDYYRNGRHTASIDPLGIAKNIPINNDF